MGTRNEQAGRGVEQGMRAHAPYAPSPLHQPDPRLAFLYVLDPERLGSISLQAVLLDDGKRTAVEMPHLWTTADVCALVSGPKFTGLVHAAGWVPGMRLSV